MYTAGSEHLHKILQKGAPAVGQFCADAVVEGPRMRRENLISAWTKLACASTWSSPKVVPEGALATEGSLTPYPLPEKQQARIHDRLFKS